MVRGEKVGHGSNFKKRVRSKDVASDNSDEDYVVSEEGNEESEDDAEDYRSSLDDCALEEGFGSFVDEEEEDEDEEEKEKEVTKVVWSKAKRMSSARKRKIVDRKSGKRKCVSDEEEEDDDYEEEEEDDDEEFTLDEEEELTMKKNMKASKQGLWKSGPSEHRKKRKKSAVSKKPSRKGGRKKRRLKRKKGVEELEDDDCDFIDNTPLVRKRSRTNAGRRKKAYAVLSDSDFLLSGSSDYEHIISVEDREQVKEASELCGSLKTSLRSSLYSKRIQEVGELGQCKKPPGRKGKEKLEETKAELIKPVCGICLSEEDKRRLRGTLNCCCHYFCFPCIMEWSKVESRCPLCKQRFETISKPARSTAGVDLRDVVVQVPKRDQVYQPSEEELRSYLDPYENVICSECHQGGDDELMLLCDLCDSSAHTYCVGLGQEVPEGNWHCDGCRPVAVGPSSSQVQDSLHDQRTINNLYNRLSPIVNVGESLDSIVLPSPHMPLTPSFVGLSSPRFPVVDIPAVSPVSGVGAPTLMGRRWLHPQIQNLRSINRMHLMAGRTDGISTANKGIDSVNSHIGQSRETTVLQTRTQDMGTPHQTVFEERLQDDSSSLQSRDFFSSQLGHLRRQAAQDSTTTTFNTSVNMTLWPGLAGISSNEQLRQCSNRANIGPDICGLPFSVRDDSFSMAKEQLQAMVRSHMKALSNEIDFVAENGTFNDLATSSMHTLLAACGLEHRRSEVHIVPPPSNCTHIGRVAVGQASLMKGCCLTCFDSFVKDVVKRIIDSRSRQWLSLAL